MDSTEWLTIAIPTMKRFSFLQHTLPLYLNRPEVARVVLCDETGEDATAIQASSFSNHPKLRVLVNERRLGIYENKLKCIRESQETPMVAVLDSDNLFSEEWFEVLSETVQRLGMSTIYASAGFVSIDQRTGATKTPCSSFSGTRISNKTWNSTFLKPGWNHLLNDGNWVLPSKEAFAALPTNVKSSDLEAADAIFMLQQFVKQGMEIYYVPGLSYKHIVHDGSSWLQTAKESTQIFTTREWKL
jgi:hypothetical protein